MVTIVAVGILFYVFEDYFNFITVIGSIFFATYFLAVKNFFNSYLETINKLCEADTTIFQNVNDSIFKISKYVPAFIINAECIKIFRFFKQPVFKCSAILEIGFSTFYNKSGINYSTYFKTVDHKEFSFKLNSSAQERFLLKKAQAFNSKIEIKYL